jgi:hypothetical protein
MAEIRSLSYITRCESTDERSQGKERERVMMGQSALQTGVIIGALKVLFCDVGQKVVMAAAAAAAAAAATTTTTTATMLNTWGQKPRIGVTMTKFPSSGDPWANIRYRQLRGFHSHVISFAASRRSLLEIRRKQGSNDSKMGWVILGGAW